MKHHAKAQKNETGTRTKSDKRTGISDIPETLLQPHKMGLLDLYEIARFRGGGMREDDSESLIALTLYKRGTE